MTDTSSLPDHPIRHHPLWLVFDRLWRPAAGWMVVAGTAYAGWLGPLIQRPMPEAYLLTWLTFAAAMLGLKTIEKIRGIA